MGRTRGREQPLTGKARAFADAYAGRGTGVGAARAAGYRQSAKALAVTAHELIADPRVIARISERVGAETFASWMATAPEPAPIEAPKLPTDPLVKGRGRGTPTERIELLMGAARRLTRSKDSDLVRVGIAAVLAAAELEGERGRTRRSGFDRALLPPAPTKVEPPAPAPAPDKPPAAPTTTRAPLRLFMSPEDRRHG